MQRKIHTVLHGNYLSSGCSFFKNAGLNSSDGCRKSNTTVGEQADTTWNKEATSAGDEEAASTRCGKILFL